MSEPVFELDVVRPKKEFRLAESLVEVSRRFGKSPWAQLREMRRLARGHGKVSPEEYYYYRLFDDQRFGASDKLTFAGRKAQIQHHRRCNSQFWALVVLDKLITGTMLKGLGVPTPRVIAAYDRTRSSLAFPVLRTADELAHFLRGGISYPFFAKPVTGVYSLGVVAAEAYDRANDRLVLINGSTVSIDEYVASITDAYGANLPFHKNGYLFQELIRPHAALARACGPALSTIRTMVAVGDDGPRVLRAAWKVPTGRHMADNFWRDGNMLAGIDIESGTVEQVIRGVGLQHETLDRHPDTDVVLKGFSVPDWPRLIQLVHQAYGAFPGLCLQAWDIAITDQGPMVIEVNAIGDYELPQLACGRGLLDEEFLAFLEQYPPPRGKWAIPKRS